MNLILPFQARSRSDLLGKVNSVFTGSGVWYRLRAENVPDDVGPVKSLDVSILQDRILGPVFGIRNPKSDPRIRFVGGIRGLEALKKMADSYGGAAFPCILLLWRSCLR